MIKSSPNRVKVWHRVTSAYRNKIFEDVVLTKWGGIHYKILSLESLSLDLKYEFNSDNKRMYSEKSGAIILDEGEIT